MNGSDIISSTRNDYVKMVRSLHERKGRLAHQAFIVEGEKCVRELLTYLPQTLRELIVTKGSMTDVRDLALAHGKRIVTVEPHVMNALCDCKTPQSVAAVASFAKPCHMKQGFIVALDDVTDPSNVGAIIRTADAAGCAGVLLSSGSADPYAPKAVRASMGSLFHLPVVRTDLRNRLEELLRSGYDVACAELNGVTDFKLEADKTCLVIGNESRGISEELLGLATARVRIPIYGKAESLNAAVAAGIMIYKIRS